MIDSGKHQTPVLEAMGQGLYCFWAEAHLLPHPWQPQPPGSAVLPVPPPASSWVWCLGLLIMPFLQTPSPSSWLGIPFSVPEVICLLQQGKDPCTVGRVIPPDPCLSEWMPGKWAQGVFLPEQVRGGRALAMPGNGEPRLSWAGPSGRALSWHLVICSLPLSLACLSHFYIFGLLLFIVFFHIYVDSYLTDFKYFMPSAAFHVFSASSFSFTSFNNRIFQSTTNALLLLASRGFRVVFWRPVIISHSYVHPAAVSAVAAALQSRGWHTFAIRGQIAGILVLGFCGLQCSPLTLTL